MMASAEITTSVQTRVKVLLVCLVVATSVAITQPMGVISGHVIDRESGKPVPRATVRIKNTLIRRVTDEQGAFTFAELDSGKYTVEASALGYAPQAKVVWLNGETVRMDFDLYSSPLGGPTITVTATRARERETPATFSSIDRAEIRERYTTQDVPVLLSDLPSTTYYSDAGNGIGYTYLNIRGFDARRIAVMINGIPQNDPEDHNVYWLDFPDIASSTEDIQVQRGAGSAFYGPPAIGGSVNLVTKNFATERSLTLSSGLGSYNTRKYLVSFSSGLIEDHYAFGAKLSKILSNGYRDRSWVDFNAYFVSFTRYDEHMTTQMNFYGGPVSDHLAYYGIPKSDVKSKELRRSNPILRDEEIENFSQPHYELFHEWRIAPNVTLNNSMFMVFGEGFFDYDGTWAPFSYFRLTPENGFPVNGNPDDMYFGSALIRAFVSNRQYGWLPRITINHGNGEFIAGAELRIHRSLHWGRLQRVDMSPVPIPEDYHYYDYKGAKDILSLYAHELYTLSPQVKLMMELQYAYNKYRLFDEKYIGTDFSVPYHFLNPRVGLNYNLTDTWNTYVSLAFTSREPRLKNLYDAAEASTPVSWGAVRPQFATAPDGRYDFSNPLVKPERLLDIEIGGRYATPSVTASANAFWMGFTDEIVKSGQVDRFGQPITGNAARTRHVGIELTGMYKPLDVLEVKGNVTFSNNRIVRQTDYSSPVARVLDGNPIAGFPDILANGRVTCKVDDLSLSVGGRYVGKQYTDNFKNEANTVDPYFVADAFLLYKLVLPVDISVEGKLHVNNIFNKLYAAYGEGDQFYVAAERNIFFNLSINL